MRYRVAGLALAGLGAFLWATASAEEVAQPWGTQNGNIYGTTASDSPLLRFSAAWKKGAETAWELDIRALGIDRVQTGEMSFDEEGNIYWKTSDLNGFGPARIASASPGGAIRWTSTLDGTTAYTLGAFDTTAPVVGDGGPTGRVYAIGTNAAGSVVAAFSKGTGILAWERVLPDANFQGRNFNLTPVLYNGKLFIKGAKDPASDQVKVYQVDAATGALDWSATVPGVMIDNGGMLTMVPNVAPGVHRLFFNGSSGNGSDGKPEIYAIDMDTANMTAWLAWSSEGGHVARSHVIYMPAVGRVATHTWTDFGAELYSWDLDGGNPSAYNNQVNSGHGFYDVGALDFDGNDLIVGGFDGRIVRYQDFAPNAGPASDVYYETVSWYGEPRVFGGLYQDAAGNSILVTGTNSRTDLGPDHEARVIAVDMTNAKPFPPCGELDDGPVYIDNFKVTSGDTGIENVVFDADGFTGYTLGELAGQENTAAGGTGTGTWENDNSGPSGATNVQVVVDPTGGGMGLVIKMDASGGCGGWQGITVPFAAETTDNIVVISWDQYMTHTSENLWVADNPDFARFWAIANWDSAFPTAPRGGAAARHFDGTKVPTTSGVWQHVEYRLDKVLAEVTVTVGGTTSSPPELLDPFGDLGVRGWTFELEGTALMEVPPPPVDPVFTFNTGSIADHGFTVRGGPLLGPSAECRKQQIYFFRNQGGNLVAIEPYSVAADYDADLDVDLNDFSHFQICFNGASRPPATDGCWDADMDCDGDVDVNDFAVFQVCFNGASRPPACDD